ncbi:MAG: gamma-glutamyltransferase family protein [Desulfobacteraceae bacterium]|nr:gamma-glutamyltransferase family protein [Desulfobacteraceae bacterium]
MKADTFQYPYESRRMVYHAANGMVATSQPLAAQAGLAILQKGGNAVDAAIATAACLTVVEPTSNGIGSDAFAIVWIKDKLHGLNASGPSPAGISIEALHQRGITEIPKYGWVPVTVPGAPSAWAALAKRFGRLSLTETLEPAINYARNGFPVSPVCGFAWQLGFDKYREETDGKSFSHWFDTFAPNGRPPRAGEKWCSPDHADTLDLIARTDAAAFYRGELAEKIDAFSRQYDGFLRADDLAAFQPVWVDPISVNYRDYTVWEIPPNGQGLVALMALNTLKGFSFTEKDSIETLHKQIEAVKLAFAKGMHDITDPAHMRTTVADHLSEKVAQQHRALIREEALAPESSQPNLSGTVYLCTADAEGNMVSYIQSNYMGFGSGLVVPGTGIALQNRGHNFSIDPDHANCLAPAKRTYHTIIPGFLTRGKEAVGPFGVMGGFMQPQGHVQVLMNMIDFGLNPQAALDAPRWQWIQDKTVEVEHALPQHLAQALQARGHDIHVALDNLGFGRGQIICRDPQTGVLTGASEPRTDGMVAAY